MAITKEDVNQAICAELSELAIYARYQSEGYYVVYDDSIDDNIMIAVLPLKAALATDGWLPVYECVIDLNSDDRDVKIEEAKEYLRGMAL